MSQTSHISTSGGLISTAFIENIRQARTNQRGVQPDTFGLRLEGAPEASTLRPAQDKKSPAALEARIAESWEALLERWDTLARELPGLDISQARERWILPLLRALDFQPVYQRSDIVLDDSEALRFNVSHFGWPEAGAGDQGSGASNRSPISAPQPPPIHTVAPATDLDAKPTGATGGRSAKGKSPHDMLQLFLNVSRGYRWGILTNGLHLRLLRDYHHTYSKGYVEFDLESIFETRNFADFRALYRLAHASRFVPSVGQAVSWSGEEAEAEGQAESASHNWDAVPLEMFYRDSQAAGIQVGANLQKQVREAIETLGNGFLINSPMSERGQRSLLETLQTDPVLCQQFYAELLHLVYRILFLLYAEQRGMVPRIGAPLETLYRQSYSLTVLRARAESDPTSPEAFDLWEGLKVTFNMFQKGAPELGVFAYNGMLFAEDQTPLLEGQFPAGRGAEEQGSGGDNSSPLPPSSPAPLLSLRCRNLELLRAIRALTLVEREGVLQRISYADLNVEEIGGIYESLLDFAPRVTTHAEQVEGRDLPPHTFFLDPRGTARKTTGSYYTHPSLVNALIESALMPVLEARLKEVGSRESGVGREEPPTPYSLLLTPSAREAAESAILSLKVCDPAAGSGHFLIAANNALALRLAQIRSGDDYPGERELRRARRDVLAHCIYGVDLNPMAVELCKVALWINAAVDDAPLSFLDHHLKVGNSLIGATPALLKEGIPDAAFEPVSGDDPKVATAVRKRNKQERAGQLSLWRLTVLETLTDLARWRELNQLAEDSPQVAESRYRLYRADPAYRSAKLTADLWTAAFFWPLDEDNDLIPTEEIFRQAQADPSLLPDELLARVEELARRYHFFHWHLEFRDIFGEDNEGGFDVVLGNPPWESLEFKTEEYFAYSAPEIASAPNQAVREKMISDLKRIAPKIYENYHQASRDLETVKHFVKHSKCFILSGKGTVNIYALFAELDRSLIKQSGRMGIVIPTSIATEWTYRNFFREIADNNELVSLYDFQNRSSDGSIWFQNVHSSYHFCLFTLSRFVLKPEPALVCFYTDIIENIRSEDKTFQLLGEDILRINPNTLTVPVFRHRSDANLTRKIYQYAPAIVTEGEATGEEYRNDWAIVLKQGLYNISSASDFFQGREQLTDLGLGLRGNQFIGKQDEKWVPLYEDWMIFQFDHRYNSHESDNTTTIDHQNPDFLPMPRYWIEYERTIGLARDFPQQKWFFVFRDRARSTDMRTAIFGVVPFSGVTHPIPMIGSPLFNSPLACVALANFNSYIFDYVIRQKLSGYHLTFYVLKQQSMVPPDRYTPDLLTFIVPRVLELTYTAWDLRSFADDVWAEAGAGGQGVEAGETKPPSEAQALTSLQQAILRQWEENRTATRGGHAGAEPPLWAEVQGSRGAEGNFSPTPPGSPAPLRFPHPPFKWDDTRRAQLRADLDGLYGHLYGLSREELAYILDTFPIVRRKDEAQFGEYRTKRLVLEAYDKL